MALHLLPTRSLTESLTLDVISRTNFIDPLEQFEVTRLTAFASTYATSLTAVLVVVTVFFGTFGTRVENKANLLIKAIYGAVVSLVKENLYLKKQRNFTALFFLFVILFFSNVLGLLPFSFTVTSSAVFAAFLALVHFVGVNLIGVVRQQWNFFSIFLPSGTLAEIAPLVICIEMVSYIARVVSLSIRLFANMLAGHALLKILTGFSLMMLGSGVLMAVAAVIPWAIVTAVMVLEAAIAFLQAYVFTLLVTLYINDVVNLHD